MSDDNKIRVNLYLGDKHDPSQILIDRLAADRRVRQQKIDDLRLDIQEASEEAWCAAFAWRFRDAAGHFRRLAKLTVLLARALRLEGEMRE